MGQTIKCARQILLPAVKEFTVGEFYINNPDIDISDELFQKNIFEKIKNEKLSLRVSELWQNEIKGYDSDYELQKSFGHKSIIPIRKFMCQLKALIELDLDALMESKPGVFKKPHVDNIFHVDISELGGQEKIVRIWVNCTNSWKYRIYSWPLSANIDWCNKDECEYFFS